MRVELKDAIRALGSIPLLYTDTISGKQICRDDMWAITTDDIEKLRALSAQPAAPVDERRDVLMAIVDCSHEIETDFVRLYRVEGKAGNALRQTVDRVMAVKARAALPLPPEPAK